jgi:CBS domain-containing protein
MEASNNHEERERMKSVKTLLEGKSAPHEIVFALPDESVLSALKKMAEANVGALIVMTGEKMVGIFSERDYARKVALAGRLSSDTPVADIMTSKVCYVTTEHTVDQCLAIISEGRFRHLPVLDESQKVVGVVSIGDLVAAKMAEQEFIIEQLEHYING